MPFFDIAGMTSIGRIRAHNEDSFLTADLTRSLRLGPSSLSLREGEIVSQRTQGKLLAVADGIAGSGGGALASSVALRVMARYVTNVMEWLFDDDSLAMPDRLQDEFEHAFQRCQSRVYKEARRLGYDHAPATTLTMAYILWPKMFLAHVGDSRCYLYRSRRLRRLTSLHTLAQQMVDHKLLDVDKAENTPFAHVLVNAVGGERDDLHVEFGCHQLQSGDRLLLCTDGLTAHLSQTDIATELDRAVTSEMGCRRLINLANERGGSDNTTVIVAGMTATEQERQRHVVSGELFSD